MPISFLCAVHSLAWRRDGYPACFHGTGNGRPMLYESVHCACLIVTNKDTESTGIETLTRVRVSAPAGAGSCFNAAVATGTGVARYARDPWAQSVRWRTFHLRASRAISGALHYGKIIAKGRCTDSRPSSERRVLMST